jgi:outer membrane protein
MMSQLFKKFSFLTFLTLFSLLQGNTQSISDTLTFQTIVDAIIKNNPVIKQAEDKTSASHWKEQLAKTSYYPNVYAAASVGRLYPLSSFDFSLPDPQTGEMTSTHFQMVPDYSMDIGIKVNQMIYDFGKTQNSLGLQKTITDMNELTAEQLKQRFALTAAGYFYNLLYIQSAIEIKSDEISTLKQHLEFIQNRQRTGSATQYEVLSTQVRISANETQLTDLQSSREVLLSHLNQLMGETYTVFAVKNEIVNEELPVAVDTFYNYALTHRFEMLIAEKNKSVAEWNYKVECSRNNPSLSFFGGTGFKNGYIADINMLKYNYNAGLNLNIPLFEGNRERINKRIAGLGISDTEFEIENLHHEISDELKENSASLELSAKKIVQFKKQLEQATEAYNHAKTNFEAGVITNLDLLDASNNLSESKLMLLKAQIDYAFNWVKFRAAAGAKVY